MNITLPQPTKDFTPWASQLIVALRDAFLRVPEPTPGVMVLWEATTAVPLGYLECDGTEYPVHISPGLRRLFGESTPGNFEVPTVAGPAGTIVVIKT
jgi:hypothetical protein